MHHHPHDKRTLTKYTKNLAAFRTREDMSRTERYEEEALHKAVVEANRPHVQRGIIWMRIIMTAANCSPTVASRRTKYDDDFGFPTLLGAHPLDHTARASPTRHAKYRHGSRI
jgi:hypothetical protein